MISNFTRAWLLLGCTAAGLSLITSLPRLAEARKRRGAEPTPTEPAELAEPEAPAAPLLFPDGVPVETPALPDGLANLSAQGCNACHFTVHDAWRESAHAGAWDSEPFVTAVQAAGEAPLCLSCHLPLTAQQRELVVSYSGGPLTTAELIPNEHWDATLQQEGVTCAACHIRDGQVLGPRASDRGPHPVLASEELSSSELCAACHQLTWPGADKPFYDTWGEWSRSSWAAAGVRCQDCHMPPISGLVTAGRYAAMSDHRVVADPARAVSVLVDLPPQPAVRGQLLEAQVTVQNTGAGHSFPTGSPFRYVLLEVAVVDADGELLGEPVTRRFAREVTSEPPYTTTDDTRIPAGGQQDIAISMELPVRGAAGRGSFRVRMFRGGPEAPGTEPAVLDGAPFLEQTIPLVID